VRNSPTIGSALRMLTAHQHMNGGGVGFVLNRGGVVDLGYAIFQPGVIGASQIYDAAMAAACNFLRELCGNGWTPLEVHFPYSKPRDVEPYRRFFRAPLRFDSEFCALRFAVDWLHRPIENADPERMRIAQEEAVADDRGDLLQQVCSALRVQLLSDSCSGDDVAQVLAMHRRTLNRRLHAQGETFQNVLDEVRFEVARQLLSDTELALDDIAAATGYAGVSPFMRSFRRWSGTTPTRWRRIAGAQHGRVHA
jgi:AraC-like DNA-binding protein